MSVAPRIPRVPGTVIAAGMAVGAIFVLPAFPAADPLEIYSGLRSWDHAYGDGPQLQLETCTDDKSPNFSYPEDPPREPIHPGMH